LLFDSSTSVLQPQPAFAEAVARAERHLQTIEYLVNVYQARRNGYPPLPIRMAVVADPPGEVLSLSRQILLQAAQQATRPEDSEATPPTPSPPKEPIKATVRNRFQAWQDRLLDLSTRNNRLLHLGQLSNNRRRPAALILDVPEALLPELVNLLDTGRPFSLLGDQGSGQGDEGLARTALELSRGLCRTRLALDSEEPMPAEALLKTARRLKVQQRTPLRRPASVLSTWLRACCNGATNPKQPASRLYSYCPWSSGRTTASS